MLSLVSNSVTNNKITALAELSIMLKIVSGNFAGRFGQVSVEQKSFSRTKKQFGPFLPVSKVLLIPFVSTFLLLLPSLISAFFLTVTNARSQNVQPTNATNTDRATNSKARFAKKIFVSYFVNLNNLLQR
jgi:hypothetical protein